MPPPQKILVLGSRGRLGGTLARRCAEAGMDVLAWGRGQLDLLRPDAIEATLANVEFDCLLNAAGTTAVDDCERHPEAARATNALSPARLASVCAARGARLIHFSTDYVFSGLGNRLLREDDPADPVNAYGRTKLEGERAVLAACPTALVARVSWLFAREGNPTFPDTIIARALEGDDVSAVADKWSCPTYVEDLAGWVLPFLDQHRATCGLLHLCNTGACTWADYGQFALHFAADELRLPVKTRIISKILTSDVRSFIAKRPPFTAMDTGRFTQITGLAPRPWQDALAEYLRGKHGGSSPRT